MASSVVIRRDQVADPTGQQWLVVAYAYRRSPAWLAAVTRSCRVDAVLARFVEQIERGDLA